MTGPRPERGTYFSVSEIVPSSLEMLVPCATPYEPHPDPVIPPSNGLGAAGNDAVHEAAWRILAVSSAVCSKWFSAMRSAIGRERERQRSFREANGLAKSTRLPYQAPSLTPEEQTAASVSESVFRAMFGDSPADYARDKFRHAIDTGDMRAFKIRLIILKARDSLAGTSLYATFVDGVEDCIARAEKEAGCIPDPSPRRLSRKEQERKAKKEARERAQQMLPLIWPDSPEYIEGCQAPSVQDIVRQGCHDKAQPTDIKEVATDRVEGSLGHVLAGEETGGSTDSLILQDIEKSIFGASDKTSEPTTPKIIPEDTDNRRNVTVTTEKSSHAPIRKAREYNTVEQILDDIESGAIVPYESEEEICEDLSSGRITAVDALMFTDALGRYCADVDVDDMDERYDDKIDDWREDEQEEEDEDALEESEEDDRYVRRRSTYSYNPNGFAGLGGCSESDADWNRDDEW